MLRHCACCNALFRSSLEGEDGAASASRHCDRCEVAYLEFKLGLLLAAYRNVVRKEPGPQAG